MTVAGGASTGGETSGAMAGAGVFSGSAFTLRAVTGGWMHQSRSPSGSGSGSGSQKGDGADVHEVNASTDDVSGVEDVSAQMFAAVHVLPASARTSQEIVVRAVSGHHSSEGSAAIAAATSPTMAVTRAMRSGSWSMAAFSAGANAMVSGP